MVRYLPRSKCCRKTTRARLPCAYNRISPGQVEDSIFISDSEDDEIGSDNENRHEQAAPSAKGHDDGDMIEVDVGKAQAGAADKYAAQQQLTLGQPKGEGVEEGQNRWRLADTDPPNATGHVSDHDDDEEEDELEALGVKELWAVQGSCQRTLRL